MRERFSLFGTNSTDTIDIVSDENGLSITIDNPWAGDSYSGIGRTTTVRLDKNNVQKLAEWLNKQKRRIK